MPNPCPTFAGCSITISLLAQSDFGPVNPKPEMLAVTKWGCLARIARGQAPEELMPQLRRSRLAHQTFHVAALVRSRPRNAYLVIGNGSMIFRIFITSEWHLRTERCPPGGSIAIPAPGCAKTTCSGLCRPINLIFGISPAPYKTPPYEEPRSNSIGFDASRPLCFK